MTQGTPSPGDARREELAHRLAAVQARVDAACAAAGREPGDVTTIVVTKTYPTSDIALLADLGVREVGEARADEGLAKRTELSRMARLSDPSHELPSLTWHAIGRLQTNKASKVAAWADAIHSLDRPRLVDVLDRALGHVGRRALGFVQVSLDGDPGRGGVPIGEVARLADRIAETDNLDLAGVMAVAPLGRDPAEAFAALAELSWAVRAEHPDAGLISAGMSGDLEQAIAYGATHLRVGTAVLGSRPPLQ